jgi:membrane protease YdiL (CAAX protease family)
VTDNEDATAPIPPVIDPPLSPPPRKQWTTWVEIVLASGIPTQFLILGVLVTAGIMPMLPDGSLSRRFVMVSLLTDTVLLLGVIIFLLRRRGERPAGVFFGGRPPLPEIGAGVLSFPLVIALMVTLMLVIRRFVPSLHNVAENPLEKMLGDDLSIYLFLIVVILAGGVREELQRAFLLHRFRGDLGQPWLGLVITSLAFGLGHQLQGLDAAVVTGTLGAIWGAMYLTRRSALAAIVSHSLFNSAQLVVLLMR